MPVNSTATAYLIIASAEHCSEAIIVVWRSISVVPSHADLLDLRAIKIYPDRKVQGLRVMCEVRMQS
jgi:hypothetical protein